jgi:hypothetical protein
LRNSIRATAFAGAIVAAFAAGALAACDERAEGAESPGALSASIVPHVDRIARFDRWAHRVASASGAWRSRSALEETAFSQVRSDPTILGAWIERPGQPPLAYPPETQLPTTTPRTVQVPPLGACEVASAELLRSDTSVPVLLVALEHDGLRTTLALARAP